MAKKYDLNERYFGTQRAARLNPDIVSTHINEDIGNRHLPFPMVKATSNEKAVDAQDKNRHTRIGLPSRYKRF